MNCPSRTDEPPISDGYNQSPNPLSNDLTTNADLNGLANSRELRRTEPSSILSAGQAVGDEAGGDNATTEHPGHSPGPAATPPKEGVLSGVPLVASQLAASAGSVFSNGGGSGGSAGTGNRKSFGARLMHVFMTIAKFIGPGFMIAVAYIDPGNYATDIAAGASYRFRLLFIVLLSNIFAIYLQSLSIKLGSVTGLNLAQACRAYLPRWLNYFLYALAEIAIIATDIAEVIGTAIAINLLIPQVPLVAGCAISILDVMVILFFYKPNGSMRGLRTFEIFVMALVLAVVICFCIQLSLIQNTTVGEVFQGYLPSSVLVEKQALYQACGILGATVMPHSLYLGSGICQARLREYDLKKGLLGSAEPPRPVSSSGSSTSSDGDDLKTVYIPSLAAIRHSMKYSIGELAVSLFFFALFVNSAILITAGASLYQNPDALAADIFEIHSLLSSSISTGAGTIFALALLFSGVSAGIVCTIAGQMVCEGALNWTIKPWMRRLITRLISITPSIVIAGAVGRTGLDAALNGSQVALSIVLPFVSAPLIWFTCFNKYMTVHRGNARYQVRDEINVHGRLVRESEGGLGAPVKMANNFPTAVFGVLIWLVMAVMNVANLVLLGLGE